MGYESFDCNVHRVGGHEEIFDAELAGLMMAAKRAVNFSRDRPEISTIHNSDDLHPEGTHCKHTSTYHNLIIPLLLLS